jgi:hypothetical protein
MSIFIIEKKTRKNYTTLERVCFWNNSLLIV